MSGEWKPGDVALVNGRVCINAGDGWEHGDPRAFRFANHQSLDIRPLVVIDPEDAEQVERLIRLFDLSDRLPETQAALREFARPTPRIEEPNGLGAVVEDAEGKHWIRDGRKGNDDNWFRADLPGCSSYAQLSVVRILSPGVTP